MDITNDGLCYRQSGLRSPMGSTSGLVVRKYYVLHYVLSGSGYFESGGKRHIVCAKSGFLVEPSRPVEYGTSQDDPWSVAWVSFDGVWAKHQLKNIGFLCDSSIFTYNKDDSLMKTMTEMVSLSNSCICAKNVILKGYTRIVLGLLLENIELNPTNKTTEFKNNLRDYVKKSVDYIYANYAQSLSISDIAQHVNLDKKYLSNLFTKEIGMPPHRFLIELRLRRSAELLLDPTLNIATVSRSVGYLDPLRFSKIFKQYTGCSPSEFRLLQKKEQTEIINKLISTSY